MCQRDRWAASRSCHETLVAIVAIGKKGEQAAATFLAGDDKPGFDFDEHRWVRLLLLMDHLERELFAARKVASPHRATVAEMAKNVEDLFSKQRTQNWYRPHRKKSWSDEAQRRMNALFAMIDTWDPRPTPAPVSDVENSGEVAAFRAPTGSQSPPAGDAVFFQKDRPFPSGALRVTSEV